MIFSCSSKEKRVEITKPTETKTEQKLSEAQEEVKPDLTFEETQDSLLKVLLKSKPNKSLKSSILRELYIRGLVNQVDDEISFELPFNLHGLDCGAPDCYSTDISFKIKSSESIEFPENIKFTLFEHGCVDQDKSIKGEFKLSEKSTEFINYFSNELKSNLIIKRNGQLYYYPHEGVNSVSLKTIDIMFKNYEFEDAEIVPFQATIMTSQSQNYEYFIKDE
jgi:hypothetical protein